ncbi:hypothetical protein K445DRAFT_8529 [Daldinia sp. EC12]|nr:hypothetical protein K445DRAFT_8529 [Daldinia sp. EC12]
MTMTSTVGYIHSSVKTIDIMVQNKPRHPLPKIQTRPNRNTQRRRRRHKPFAISLFPVNRLSKRTLCQYLNAITAPLALPQGRSHLEYMPQDIINRISQYVPYENLIYLSWVSKSLYGMVDPYLAPHETKLAFVVRAERDFYRHYSGLYPNLGCFMCFKVLPAGLFACDQPLRAELRTSAMDEPVVVDLRRFCVGCGIQLGLHKAGEEFTTRTGGRFWICNCLCILGEQELVCKGCSAVCQLKPKKTRDTYR